MKLILTDYIASMKEEKELDSLIESMLREYDFEIFYGPIKGVRQYGVDIYAVGKDWLDEKLKVFLITVKQGDLNRKSWEGTPQAVQPSLVNIVDVFIRNNISPEHLTLPIKIIVAHNGANDASIQQNWRAFADKNKDFEFEIWQLEHLVELVRNKMINENILSNEGKKRLRRIIINLGDTDYDFSDYIILVDEVVAGIDFSSTNTRNNIHALRKINLLLEIIISYCIQEKDLRLAMRVADLTLLSMWKVIEENVENLKQEYYSEFIRCLKKRYDVSHEYLQKFIQVFNTKNGLSVKSKDAVSYSFTAFEHLGYAALSGLMFYQFYELTKYHNSEDEQVKEYSLIVAEAITHLITNNPILLYPRADEHSIEICLFFILLMKLGCREEISHWITTIAEKMGEAKIFCNIAPHYLNNLEEIIELEINSEKRKKFEYKSSSLIPMLAEWSAAILDEKSYQNCVELLEVAFNDIDLVLWFPDAATNQNLLSSPKAHRKTGYSLSDIELTKCFSDFVSITRADFENNCSETESLFIKEGFWIVGLIACRHHRTYIPPYYWRQFLPNISPISRMNKNQH